MMIKDLEICNDLARDERCAVRGGYNTILPGGCFPQLPPGPHVPTVEELLSKFGDVFKPTLPTDNPIPVEPGPA
jgi:hypothetical protein